MLQTFYPKIAADVPWEVRQHLQLIYSKLNNHAQAISTAAKAAATVTTINRTVETSTGGGSGGTMLTGLGGVNNQAGQTAYTTQNSDGGILVVLSDASPIAVTLNVGVGVPWFAVFGNMGAGTATLTPQSGTISYFSHAGAGSMPLLGGFWCWVGFDGTNFWAAIEPIVPVNTPAVTHEWLDSYNATTGAFTQSQPAIADVNGLSAALAAKAPIASPTFTGTVTQPDATVLTAATTASSATAGGATALPATPAGYLQVSINGVLQKIPYFAV